MGNEPPPDNAWLRSLQIRYWLQLPPRDRGLNSNREAPTLMDSCEVWPLDQTGAVEVHFKPGEGIELQPWVALPTNEK